MNNVKPLEINFAPTKKQDEIFEAFADDITTEVLYGGSAGSAKSYGLCALMILKCLEFPGIRIGLARNELTILKKTTITSFFEVTSSWGLIPEEHFSYNSTAGIIKFYNSSEIVLVELSSKPSDPDFVRLGGLLFTFGCIDEVAEIEEKGFNMFKSRLGRWKNTEYNIKPIVISTCNPSKNWIYRNYFQPFRDGTLASNKRFIQALPSDNPYIPKAYIDNLMTLPFADRERLLHGNWDYSDDPSMLMTHESILNVFEMSSIPKDLDKEPAHKKFITVDVAFTSDKMVVMLWYEHTICEIHVNPQEKIEDFIVNLATKYRVPAFNIAFDSDGVGKFLTTRLPMAKGIVNNSQAYSNENYRNLKTQFHFKLAELVNNSVIKCAVQTYKNEMIEELSVIKHKVTDKTGKIEMIDKAEVKRLIGHSPDFTDCMSLRMNWEFKTAGVKSFKIG